jgi:hypothetical protein
MLCSQCHKIECNTTSGICYICSQGYIVEKIYCNHLWYHLYTTFGKLVGACCVRCDKKINRS